MWSEAEFFTLALCCFHKLSNRLRIYVIYNMVHNNNATNEKALTHGLTATLSIFCNMAMFHISAYVKWEDST